MQGGEITLTELGIGLCESIIYHLRTSHQIVSQVALSLRKHFAALG